MKYLLDSLYDIWAYVDKKKHVYIFSDFDGTLTPIRKHPEDVRLSDGILHTLLALQQAKNTTFVVVSGRKMKDLKHATGGIALNLIASHGLENNLKYIPHKISVTDMHTQTMYELKSKIEDYIQTYPDAKLDVKPFSFAVHWRNLKPDKKEKFVRGLETIVTPFVNHGTISILPGKQVMELMVNSQTNKGTVCREYLHEMYKGNLSDVGVIAIGDDISDESMMKEFPGDITIGVGNAIKHARYHAPTIGAVHAFLKKVASHQIARLRTKHQRRILYI